MLSLRDNLVKLPAMNDEVHLRDDRRDYPKIFALIKDAQQQNTGLAYRHASAYGNAGFSIVVRERVLCRSQGEGEQVHRIQRYKKVDADASMPKTVLKPITPRSR